jgi:alkaline phosphatase
MLKRFGKSSRIIAALVAALTLTSIAPASNVVKAQGFGNKTVKNVILLIPDGMAIGATTLTRWYNGGEPLAMDEMACGLIRTFSSDAAIADSAPAGTAMATGFKSHTGFVGVLPDKADMPGLDAIKAGEEKRPVASILEAAKLKGKATGLIATCELPHATPADFSAHYPSRKDYNTLSEQELYNNVDVVLGGGYAEFTKEKRDDKEDLISVIKNKGYDLVQTKDAMKNSKSNKIFGLFAPEALKYDMDEAANSNEPTLQDMTEKAINTLSKDQDGFFLMVEGSKIDWAAHANDPVGVVSDVNSFDKTVKLALDFAKKDGNTAVIVAADHGTGGISVGDTGTSGTYDKEPLSTFVNPLKKATLTGEGLEEKINADKSNIKEVMSTYFGITDLTEDEEKAIKEAKAGSLNYTVGPIISKRAHIGWTTTGHVGDEVALYMYHPNNYIKTGVILNTDIAKYMEEVLGLNLKDTTDKLFIQAKPEFEFYKKATVSVDASDKQNLVLVVKKGDTQVLFPQNKDIAIVNGKTVSLPGVTVYTGDNKNIDASKWYLSKYAINLIQ